MNPVDDFTAPNRKYLAWIVADGDVGPKLVKTQPLHQITALAAVHIDDQGVVLAQNDEVKEDFALWCQQRAESRLIWLKVLDIAGDKILHECDCF